MAVIAGFQAQVDALNAAVPEIVALKTNAGGASAQDVADTLTAVTDATTAVTNAVAAT